MTPAQEARVAKMRLARARLPLVYDAYRQAQTKLAFYESYVVAKNRQSATEEYVDQRKADAIRELSEARAEWATAFHAARLMPNTALQVIDEIAATIASRD